MKPAPMAEVYGRLRVIGREGRARYTGEALYRCVCSCGTSLLVRGRSLRHDHTQSCGCLQRERVAEANRRPGRRRGGGKAAPVAETYGRLRVIERAGSTNDGEALYRCVCSCGTRTTVRSTNLRSGTTKSCGCLRRERGRVREVPIAETYGRLRVIGREGAARDRSALYRCVCSCGTSLLVRGKSLRRGSTKSCGCLRDEIAAARGRQMGFGGKEGAKER